MGEGAFLLFVQMLASTGIHAFNCSALTRQFGFSDFEGGDNGIITIMESI